MKLRHIINEMGSRMPSSMVKTKSKLDSMNPDEIRAFFKNREDFAKQHAGGVIRPGFSAKELAQRQEFSYGREFAKGRPYSKHFESTQKPYVSQAADGKWNVLDKDGKTVFSSGNYNVAQDYFKKNYNNLKEIELDEGLKDWLQKMAVAGIIVGSVAGIGSINNAINNNVPVIQAMNKALDIANQKGDKQLIQNIKQDIEVARLSLDSGRDLNTVKQMQDRYAKFMPADYKPNTPAPKFKEAEQNIAYDPKNNKFEEPEYVVFYAKSRYHKIEREYFDSKEKAEKFRDQLIAQKFKIVDLTSWKDHVNALTKRRIPSNTIKVGEEVSKTDTLTIDIPMFIRLMEYAREDAKTDMDLHNVTSNLLKIKDKIISMADYDQVVVSSDVDAADAADESFKDKIVKKIAQPIKDYNKNKEQPKKS